MAEAAGELTLKQPSFDRLSFSFLWWLDGPGWGGEVDDSRSLSDGLAGDIGVRGAGWGSRREAITGGWRDAFRGHTIAEHAAQESAALNRP